MNARMLNILLIISLLVVFILNFDSLLQPFNGAFGWHIHTPIGRSNLAQEFRYWAPEAGEVYLVWGEKGWLQISDKFRPPGTVIEFGVLHTPMIPEGDAFVTRLRLPVGTELDYGFQIRTKRDGTATEWTWDGDFQQIVTADNLIEVRAAVDLLGEQDAKNHVSTPIVTRRTRSLISPALAALVPAMAQLQAYSQIERLSYPIVATLVVVLGVLVTGIALVMYRRVIATDGIAVFSARHGLYLRDLLRELVGREMKLRYRRSVLGMAWSLLNPLLQLLVFGFVFRYVLPLGVENYTLFLFSGLLVWNWLQGSLVGATTAIVDGGNLIKRPGFPAAILPIVTVSANLIHFLLALPILAFFLLQAGVEPSFTMMWLPVIIALQFVFTLSLAYLLATIHVSFRDTQYLVGVLLLLFFYLTPIFYDAHIIPARFQPVYQLNPIFHLVEAYRAILLRGEPPIVEPLVTLAALSTALLLLGYQVFTRASYGFVEEL